jgi:hypothetical protein
LAASGNSNSQSPTTAAVQLAREGIAGPASEWSEHGNHPFLVFDDTGIPTILEEEGFEILHSYPTYHLISNQENGLEKARELGLHTRDLPEYGLIFLDPAWVFDPLHAFPEIPAWGIAAPSKYFIVQFGGPATPDLLSRLNDHCSILRPLRDMAYVIEINEGMKSIEGILGEKFVRWVGPYHPAFRVREGFEERTGETGASVVFFKSNEKEWNARLQELVSLGAEITNVDHDTNWWDAVTVKVPVATIYLIAGVEGLEFIEPTWSMELRLDTVRWTVQSHNASTMATPVWDQGIHGEGVIVGGADTGIFYQHVAFRETAADVGTIGPSHRKIVRYNDSVDDYDDQGNNWHGTHTMGTIIGDKVDNPGVYDVNDGIAYNAKLAFYDVTYPNDQYDPPIISEVLMDAYKCGARSHSDSWGDDTPAYTARAQRMDQFQWDYSEFLIFVAPGNGGTVLEPATAKNIVSVGNSYNGESKDIVSGSPVGPTKEGVRNPTVVAPGLDIYSPRGGGQNRSYSGLSGTSLSTPVAAGSTALIQQYFQDGFYPTGTQVPADGFSPSGPLKKAVLVNGAMDLAGGRYGSKTIPAGPNNYQGWGKVNLNHSLYFDGDQRNMWIYDGYNDSVSTGLSTGDKESYVLHVNSSEPFEVSLVWNDYPGVGLIQDLDLTVMDPLGNEFKGNVYQAGESATGGTADSSNPVESVLFTEPVEGYYVINISAISVSYQTQRYALAVTGSIYESNRGGIELDKDIYSGTDRVHITVVDSDLAQASVVEVKVSSTSEPTAETLLLTSTDTPGILRGSIQITTDDPAPNGKIDVSDGDQILARYFEAAPAGTRIATALVDAAAPGISNVRVTDITNESAIIRWETDEPATSIVEYGRSKGLGLHKNLTTEHVTSHVVPLTNLFSNTMYFFDVESTDVVGNTARDDKGGNHYSFRTASYMIQAQAGYAGWVREGETFNHFDDGNMWVGNYSNLIRHGAMLFNLTDVPDNADIVGATLRLYGKNRGTLNGTTGQWDIDLLPIGIESTFDGTTSHPTYGNVSSPAGNTVGFWDNSDLEEGAWTSISIPNQFMDDLTDRIGVDAAVFRINGDIGASESMFVWDTGNEASPSSLGKEYAPVLALTVNLAPVITDDAPDTITFLEDQSGFMELGTVFSDDGPLEYEILRDPATASASMNGSTVELDAPLNWNGDDNITFKATDTNNLTATYEMDILVIPVNDAPSIVTVDGKPAIDGMVINATQDVYLSVLVEADDPDLKFEGDDLTFMVINNSRFSFFGENLTFIPTNSDVGDQQVTITVTDKETVTVEL